MAIWVEAGQDVTKGQQLCEGNLDLRELFKLVGKEETQRYIVKEIQKIYASQGATIHDKHIEVIVRQMFSRLRIKEPGDSSFTVGEIVSRERFLEENALLKKQNKDFSQRSSYSAWHLAGRLDNRFFSCQPLLSRKPRGF